MPQPSFDLLASGQQDQCVNHPQSPAIQRCRQCRASICGTCDFAFPGGLHLCPTCATATASGPMSSSRKTMLAVSFVAAVFTTGVLAALFTGVFQSAVNDEAFVQVFGMVLLASVVAGLGMSLASLDGRAGNPAACWVSVVWNVVLAVLWLGLIVVGTFAG